jgi:hypothetical protein
MCSPVYVGDEHFKTITMKTFGVVGEENKKSTRKKCQNYDLLCP